MLPPIHRLHREADLKRTLQQGRLFRSSCLTIRSLKRGDEEPTRLATVVGKRVHASAIRRHQYQRWLREAGRELIQALPVGYDMVVVAQPPLARLTSLAEISEDMRAILKLLKEKQ